MTPIVDVRNLTKTFDGGFQALKGVDLEIRAGEILALLGANGAGKTTLISILCGITTPTDGTAWVGGNDVVRDWRGARQLIGLVPQEINLEPFETVSNTVRLSRGLFGLKPDNALIERILRTLSLWDKKDTRIKELSGGMKRRVLIAKALSHEPRVLFLDEPSAGVDVELRKDMWETVAQLKSEGVTIILTTHYIEEAEEIADRVAVIRAGEILLVEETDHLMQRLGRKELRIDLREPLTAVPDSLAPFDLVLAADGMCLTYSYDTHGDRTGIASLMAGLQEAGIVLRDIQTHQSSLEEIFVGMIKEDAA
ncbi:ABC transporter ATP-binding protein [Pseudooceanicola aestuarii]|uniref:ABC transporter ATP-binding protein n=1 Tax=Pseudooceanicola aestuarii TaxID=2697319 RepID=UPI0013D8C2C5|nr:ABC transporter ATP-binding protein [Pseudooceanicola aestuarii]